MALLWFDPNNPILSNWLAFTQEFSSKFSIFDTVAEVEENFFNFSMHNNKCFTTFIIVQFKQEAYKTGWNYNTLWFTLCCALPQCIKDVLHLMPKQTMYDGYKVLITQVDQHYWKPSGTPPATPTGRLEQPTATDPQSLQPLPISYPTFPQDEDPPAPIKLWDPTHQLNSML
ncbi:hypothetical protein J132_05935 [Termitomyces sp. J132]|nr:hypothetical protein J132_05935 [Termitomyces sp. J132]